MAEREFVPGQHTSITELPAHSATDTRTISVQGEHWALVRFWFDLTGS